MSNQKDSAYFSVLRSSRPWTNFLIIS